MPEWKERSLGELVNFVKGKKVDTTRDDVAGTVPYLGAGAICGGHDGYAYPGGGVWATKQDVLMLWDGERSGLVGTHLEGIVSSTVAKLTPKATLTEERGAVTTELLYYLLSNRYDWIQARRTGTGVPHVPKDLGRILRLSYPRDQLDQVRITEILGTVDQAIQETEALIAKHEMIKAGMMHDLFTRGVLPNGELRPPPTEAPDLYKPSPLGLIPKEWEVVPLSCMATVDRGKFTIRPRNDPRYYGGEFPFIQTGEVANAGGAVLVTFTQSLNQRGLEVSRIFPAGTVMVTIAANIGDTCIIGIPMCAPDSLVAVVPNDHADSRFLEMSVRRKKSRLEARAPQTAQRNINLEDLRPLKITKPHREERQHICQKYASISSVIDTEKHEVRKLASLKKGLMSVLLSPPA